MTDPEKEIVDAFRDWIARTAREKVPAVGTTRKVDGEGEYQDSLALRLYTDTQLWLEVNILPGESILRVGLASDDRTMNEDAEQLIEDSKDPMDEFLELGLADAGYEDEEGHRMDHFRESGIFYFATSLPLPDIASLQGELREQAMRLVEGYATAFEELIEDD
ncbi:MAG: hypothetical protein O3B01_16625 [Planctomycetota bacterium]|nr:hypothetical protein [Planctomycetota bacterium]MDA1140201.1 hypothetical protein [Planctomycetota bacterium]